MTNSINKNGTTTTITFEGRLDTTTAPKLEKTLEQNSEGVKDLVFDFAKLDYVSSAGLRVILSTHKKMSKVGTFKIVNVKEIIMDVFEMTGFADILTIE